MIATTPLELVLSKLERVVQRGDNAFLACCPAHEDKKQSLTVSTGQDGRVLLNCHAHCETAAVLGALGLKFTDLFPKQDATTQERARIVAEYDYRDERGELLYQVVRKEPKSFSQRQPDSSKPGGWNWSKAGVRRVPYRLPELLEGITAGQRVYITEGEKDVNRLARLGLCATCNDGGAGKWEPAFSGFFAGAAVVLIPDNDEPGRKHMEAVAHSLLGHAASVQWLDLEGLPEKGDVSDWLSAGGTVEALEDLAAAAPAWDAPKFKPSSNGKHPGAEAAPAYTGPALTIGDVVATFQKWLHMPDSRQVKFILGAYYANLTPGDAAWVMLVGPPGGGKTETLQALNRLPKIHVAATITEPSLLSGTPKKDRHQEASGGLLRQVGEFGVLVLKDFTSILSMNREGRAATLAALREIYDGSWTRHIGTDGGRTLHWAGKLGVIAGCTPTIDSHHAVIGSMGERFLFYRLPEVDDATLTLRALRHVGRESEMRAELAEVVLQFFATRQEAPQLHELTEADQARMVDLACVAARCRSAVERDSRSEIVLIPASESPARLARVLARLLGAMVALGVDREEAWEIVGKAAFDSMPALRFAALCHLLNSTEPASTSEISEAVGYPTATTRRALEDLCGHGVVDREGKGTGTAHTWTVSAWTRARCSRLPRQLFGNVGGYAESAGTPTPTLSPPLTVSDDFSEKVPLEELQSLFASEPEEDEGHGEEAWEVI